MTNKTKNASVVVLDCLGLTAVVTGCFLVAAWLGCIVAGLSLLALGWLLERDETG